LYICNKLNICTFNSASSQSPKPLAARLRDHLQQTLKMQTVTEFIIDLSGSMGDKIALTKQMLLSDIIPSLDYSSRIGIKSFSAVKDQPPVIQELALNIIDKQSIIKAINNLTVKQGGTPISEAIRQSVITLKEYSANNKKIILVTDGEEDKGGDYVAECKKAKSEGINCEIHVVGIGLNQQAQTKAQEISKLTNGTFSNIPFSKGTQYNQTVIKNNLTTFYNAVSSIKTIQPIQPIKPITPVQTIQPIKPTVPVQTVQPIIQKQKEGLKDISKTEAIPQVEIITKNEANDINNPIQQDINNEKSENTSEATNLILQTLIQEIKEIRNEIKKLKTDSDIIPEVEEDTELNERIRLISEKYLFEVLKSKYPNRVKWLNENGETGSNHDFEILEEDGSVEYYIECKGTAKRKTTFYVTKNEWNLFLNNTKNYQIYFIQNVLGSPTHIFINNLLDWLLKGKIHPYLKTRDIIKEERVFLTVSDTNFIT
jgi:hypothetical protein